MRFSGDGGGDDEVEMATLGGREVTLRSDGVATADFQEARERQTDDDNYNDDDKDDDENDDDDDDEDSKLSLSSSRALNFFDAVAHHHDEGEDNGKNEDNDGTI